MSLRRGGGQVWGALAGAGLGALACGCGATSLRLSLGPTLDTQARPGVESMLSFGSGIPLDFSGRSHHFVQARVSGGGGLDGRSGRGVAVVGGELDYLYYAEPKLDVRLGLHGLYRELPGAEKDAASSAFGAHFGAYPVVLGRPSGAAAPLLVVGPELRAEYLWAASPSAARGLFSLPLVVAVDLLVTGD